MARIRTIKPEFFRHEGLQDLQNEYPHLHPMLVFAGLWTQADGNGVFPWKPRTLHLDILPFIDLDMAAALDLLERHGFITSITTNDGKHGQVVNWTKHQKISGKEFQWTREKNEMEEAEAIQSLPSHFPVTSPSLPNHFPVTSQSARKGKGKEEEKEKEKGVGEDLERKGNGEGKPPRAATATRTSLDSNLKSFQELEDLIRDKLPSLSDTFTMDPDRLERFAADWLAKKSITGDWSRYQPGAMVNFFVNDATNNIMHMTRPLQKKPVKIEPN